MNAFTPTFTSTPLLPPLPKFLADLLYPPDQVKASKTQQEVDELEATLDAHAQEIEEPVRALRIPSPLWMEGKEVVKKIVAYRPGYRPELSVRYIRDKSRDVPEAKEPEGHGSYVLSKIAERDIPEPEIPESEMPRIGALSID